MQMEQLRKDMMAAMKARERNGRMQFRLWFRQ